MTYKVCIRPGCENPPRFFAALCEGHIAEQRSLIAALDRVQVAKVGLSRAEKHLAKRVSEARAAGASWADIGRALGFKSRQYAQRKFGQEGK